MYLNRRVYIVVLFRAGKMLRIIKCVYEKVYVKSCNNFFSIFLVFCRFKARGSNFA